MTDLILAENITVANGKNQGVGYLTSSSSDENTDGIFVILRMKALVQLTARAVTYCRIHWCSVDAGYGTMNGLEARAKDHSCIASYLTKKTQTRL